MRTIAITMVLTCAACGEVPAETKIAATIQQFQKSADTFETSRRDIVKGRQAIIDDTEDATARLKAHTDELVATWQIASDKDRLGLFNELATANKAAGEAAAALDQLRSDHAKALAAANTKVSVNQEKLTAAVKALSALGSKKTVTELFNFYVGFIQETKADVDKLQADTKATQEKAAATVAAAKTK